MDNRGFGEVEAMAGLILLLILADSLRDELAAFVSFLLSGLR